MKVLMISALIAASFAGLTTVNAASTGNGRYCVEQLPGSFDKYCNFATLKACQKQAQPQFLRCMPNPNYGTTGKSSRH